MADRVRIGTFDADERFVPQIDANDQTVYAFIRDTFQVRAPARQQTQSKSPRRYGGAHTTGETHENGAMEAEWYIGGATKQDAADAQEDLLAILEDPGPDRYVEFRPDGLSRSAYYELRGPGAWEPQWRWIEWQQTSKLHMRGTWQIGPLAFGDHMDIHDNFKVPGDAIARAVNVMKNPTFQGAWTIGDTEGDYPYGFEPYTNGGTGTDTWSRVASGGPSGLGRTLDSWRVVFSGVSSNRGFMSAWDVTARIKAGDKVMFTFWWKGNRQPEWAANETGTVEKLVHPTASAGTWQRYVWRVTFTQGGGPVGRDRFYVYADHGGAGSGDVQIAWWSVYFGTADVGDFDGSSDKAAWHGLPYGSENTLYDRSPLEEYQVTAAGAGVIAANETIAPNDTTETRLMHLCRGYEHTDLQATLEFTAGGGFFNVAVIPKMQDGSNYYPAVHLFQDGGGTVLKLVTLPDGMIANSTAVTSGAVAGKKYWLRARTEGTNTIIGELFTSPPTPLSTPAHSVTWFLVTAYQELWGDTVPGKPGFRIVPSDTAWRYNSFVVEPYTYRDRSLPDKVLMRDIPGSAPAAVDLHVTSTATARPWGLVSWSEEVGPWNRVWNGDFEEDTGGWSTGLVYTNPPDSFQRVTTDACFGSACLQVQSPASINLTGVEHHMFHKFRKGRTYTVEAWVRAASGTEVVQAFLGGVATIGGSAGGAGATLSPTWQRITATWIPTVDAPSATCGVRINDASPASQLWQLDGVTCYEGEFSPGAYAQNEGRGAPPPFGLIEAESLDWLDSSGFAITADAASSGGYDVRWTPSGAASATGVWFVDPSLVPPDEFSERDSRIEVWARVYLASTHVNPKLTLSARPVLGSGFGPERFTQEWGNAGKLVTAPSTGSAWRMIRLGVLNMVSDPVRAARWKLFLRADVGSGSSGQMRLDYLMCVPARARMAGATDKPNDASYPPFFPNPGAGLVETTRILRADGTGWSCRPNTPPYPDRSLDGQVPQFGPRSVNLLVAASNLVPDDPTLDATTETLATPATIHAAVRPRYFLARGS